jgi:hypothetical protein
MAVADADREPAAGHAGVEVEHAEHLHAVFADSVLLRDHANVAEAWGFDQGLDDLDRRHRPVSGRAQRCGDGGQLLSSQLRS